MRLIVLAAGDSFELDGFSKLLIRHPISGKTIIELYQEYFDVDTISIVVGYKAMEIMNENPDINYVYNMKWRETLNGYSLGMALSDEPCYVVSSDYIISRDIVTLLDSHENSALVQYSENRSVRSLNCKIDQDGFLGRSVPG